MESKIALACEMSINEWLATIPDTLPEPEYSKKHEKWKKKLFNKMRGDRYHRFTTKTVRVLIVAAILTALMLTAFVIPSSRQFVLDNLGIYSRLKITESNKNSVKNEITVGYIPDGFVYESLESFSKHITVKYRSVNGKFFTIFKYSSSTEVDFNTEFSDSEEIFEDGIRYVFCKGDLGTDNLIWTKNDYVYRVSGNISVENLKKIAKFVE
ncbi:MAG: DUF4367 domain-containing protein [Clostridia bacterium]|nr:DUF4367 domain-containing protein [Clostridia bacterium]